MAKPITCFLISAASILPAGTSDLMKGSVAKFENQTRPL